MPYSEHVNTNRLRKNRLPQLSDVPQATDTGPDRGGILMEPLKIIIGISPELHEKEQDKAMDIISMCLDDFPGLITGISPGAPGTREIVMKVTPRLNGNKSIVIDLMTAIKSDLGTAASSIELVVKSETRP